MKIVGGHDIWTIYKLHKLRMQFLLHVNIMFLLFWIYKTISYVVFVDLGKNDDKLLWI
jgi:hypothetical protein